MTEVVISGLGAGGDGTADGPEGRLYLPYALPGEVWRVVSGDGGAGAASLVTPHPDRQPDLCPHYGRCGGCSAQHMSDAIYVGWKRRMLVDAFAHRGLDVAPEPLLRFPEGRRRRATFAIVRAEGSVKLGFHRAGTHIIEAVEACAVLEPAIVTALPGLAEIARLVLDGGTRKKSNPRRGRRPAPAAPAEPRVVVLATDAGLAIDLVDTLVEIGPVIRTRLADAASRHRILTIALDGDVLIKRGMPRLGVGGIEVEPPPGAFVQASAAAEAAMIEIVAAGVGRARRVADLFSGLGTFAFALARRASVLAVDSDADLLSVLKHAFAHASGLKPVETLRRDLVREPLSAKELEPFDAVVFDPPRAGAQAQAEMIVRSRVSRVIAVSCNPATLARDVRVLIDGGFRLERLVPVDQFAYTAHLEVVAVLAR